MEKEAINSIYFFKQRTSWLMIRLCHWSHTKFVFKINRLSFSYCIWFHRQRKVFGDSFHDQPSISSYSNPIFRSKRLLALADIHLHLPECFPWCWDTARWCWGWEERRGWLTWTTSGWDDRKSATVWQLDMCLCILKIRIMFVWWFS